MISPRPTIAIMGVGAMGGALLTGLLNSGWEPDHITLIEAQPERAEELRTTTGCPTVATPDQGISYQQAVVLAVKPQHIEPALEQLEGLISLDTVVIAVVAGVRIDRYEKAFPGVAVVRVMPNTPALLGEGVTGCAPGTRATADHMALAQLILRAVGDVVEVEEPFLDVITALSGSGPAYAYRLAEVLAEAGIQQGLDPEVAMLLAAQSIKGAGAMMRACPEPPSELRRRVTSPNGVTEAALKVMEEGGFRELMIKAVSVGTERSRQLGGPPSDP